MLRIVFVCLGNICRSPMAEFIFTNLLNREGKSDLFEITSAATSDEAEGCQVHRGTVRQMEKHGLIWWQRTAVQLKKSDYDRYDYFIGMDGSNVKSMKKLFSGDPQNKVFKLLDFSDTPRDIADPWYTGNFDDTYDDLAYGLPQLLDRLLQNKNK